MKAIIDVTVSRAFRRADNVDILVGGWLVRLIDGSMMHLIGWFLMCFIGRSLVDVMGE